MGVDYNMCDTCGESCGDYSLKQYEFTNATNADELTICRWCFKELNGICIIPAETISKTKNEDQTKGDNDKYSTNDSDDQSEDEYRNYDGKWTIIKVFDIYRIVCSPIKFKKSKEKKP